MGLTSFPNGVSSFGVPIMGDLVTFGNVYFVDYRNGSDGNSGKERDQAFKTLTKAVASCATNNNDVIYIDGDQEISEAAMVDVTINRMHVVGCNGYPPGLGYGAGARITQATTGVAADLGTVKNTGVRNTFTGIKFSNDSATATCLYTVLEGGEYTRYNNCEFYKSGLLTTAGTAEVVGNGDSSQWYGCTFGDLVNSRGSSSIRRPNVLLSRETITGKVARDMSFVDCTFLHKAAHADTSFIYGSGTTDVERRLVFIRPIFWNCVLASATMTDGIDFGGAQTTGDVLIVHGVRMNTTYFGGVDLNIYVSAVVTTDSTGGQAIETSSP